MSTAFGKLVKKIRIDHDENAYEMAVKCGISLSYLSAIEAGKRSVPVDLGDKIISEYHLSEEQARELRAAVDESATQVKIPMEPLNNSQKQLAIAFARKVDTLSEEEIEELFGILR